MLSRHGINCFVRFQNFLLFNCRYDSDAASDAHSSSDSDDGDQSDDEPLGNVGADESNMAEDGEQTRKHKALCYEDIILWIVKDPLNKGGRDVLAMEVHLRHHKGADNKPKPYVFLVRSYHIT